MRIELTAAEVLIVPENDPIKQKYREQQAAEAREVHIDYVSPELQAMGGLAVFCAMNEPELLKAA